jgi:hypothetical protein
VDTSPEMIEDVYDQPEQLKRMTTRQDLADDTLAE